MSHEEGGRGRPEAREGRGGRDEVELILERREPAPGEERARPARRGPGPARRFFRWFSPAKVALAQGAYYVATGLWPFVSMATFLQVTGPKEELWLVRTVGGLLAIIGAVLLLGGLRGRVSFGLRMLGMAVAAFLAASGAAYVASGQVWPVFLLDAGIEVLILAAWLTVRERREAVGA